MNNQNIQRGLMMFLVLGGGLAAALFLGRAVAHGDYTRAAMIIAGLFGGLAVLLLGNRYWYAIPVTIGADLPTFQLGARNINLGELAVAGCAVVFAMRFALKQEKLDLARLRNVPVYLFFTWVMIVWAFHPVGLAGFGADVGGGRFYATVLLAMAAFIIVSSQTPKEEDVKWIFGLLLLASLLNLGRSFLEYAVLGRKIGVVQLDLETEGYYTWHQEMAGPAALISMLLLSRYRLGEIFSLFHLSRLAVFCACFVPILMSGKRAAVGMFLLYPGICAVVRREFRYLVVFGVGALLAVGFLLYGQGELFRLPLAAQRALSWLPADWDSEISNYRGGQDEFRRALREIALEEIQDKPWFPDGFRVDINETAAAYYQAMAFGTFGDIRNQVMPYALGKAWHNVWLGYAADFGIPLAVIQAFVMLTGVWCAYRAFRLTQPGSWLQTMALYCLLFFIADILLSWSSGHTANDAFTRWWRYGFIFAILSNVKPPATVPLHRGGLPAGGARKQELAPA